MSCLCPISIPDKVAMEYGIKGATLVVPCGHCAGCARDKANDWFVRIWSTYQRCMALHVPVWFVTVTLDQNLWPNMTVDSPDVGKRVTPFVRSWTERFRYLNGGKMPLRFLCSEFGSIGREYIDYKGRKRVSTGALHFHGVIFGRIPISKLQSGFAQTHGHVDFDLVRGPEGIRYCVKYALKDYSVNDPLIRARVFCSPGIGDSTFYFGESAPTGTVMINGFHYRTPRYFLDRQWQLFYGGRDRYILPDGHSRLVVSNFHRRLEDYHRLLDELSNAAYSDPSCRAHFLDTLCAKSIVPASIDEVKTLCLQGLTGPSHPLLRYWSRIDSFNRYVGLLDSDHSFVDRDNLFALPLLNQFNISNHEGYQTCFSFSQDLSS